MTAGDVIDFDLADKIEAAFDSKPADYFWAMWELARATGGGYALEPVGFEIRRGGQLVYKGDQPAVTRTGDYYDDMVDRYTEIITTLDRYRQDSPEGNPA